MRIGPYPKPKPTIKKVCQYCAFHKRDAITKSCVCTWSADGTSQKYPMTCYDCREGFRNCGKFVLAEKWYDKKCRMRSKGVLK